MLDLLTTLDKKFKEMTFAYKIKKNGIKVNSLK